MVRPERLFAPRAHPFGVALRAINLACGPSCRTRLVCLPGVRITTSSRHRRRRILRQGKLWCARRDYSRRALTPSGSPFGGSTWAAGQVVELGLFVCREFESRRRADTDDEGFSGKENYGAPGEIIRAARSPLRGCPSGDHLGLRAKLSNSACL